MLIKCLKGLAGLAITLVIVSAFVLGLINAATRGGDPLVLKSKDGRACYVEVVTEDGRLGFFPCKGKWINAENDPSLQYKWVHSSWRPAKVEPVEPVPIEKSGTVFKSIASSEEAE